MAKRYITTIMGRLNKVDPVKLEYDHPKTDVSRLRQEEIVKALTFWRFYNNLKAHVDKIKDLPEDLDQVRHELLERIISEGNLRSTVGEWLRLPVTVVETLKWSANIDFQSRESFLRRLTRMQQFAIHQADLQFFTHNVVPSCLRNGVFRTWFHKHVTYASLLAEPLVSEKRTESKSAWARSYMRMDFGHAMYPGGDMDDSVESGDLRKFLSIKNHVNDFAVNQHDGLYWFLYKHLRSNYIWNRDGDVQLKVQICPGFWLTMFSWLFLLVASPILAVFVTVPVFAGQMGLDLYTFVGMILGMVTPLLAVIASIFYVYRDTELINVLSKGVDHVFGVYSKFWIVLMHIAAYSAFTLMVGLMALICFVEESTPNIYGFILCGWIVLYTYEVIKERAAFFHPSEAQAKVFMLAVLGSIVLALLPHYAFFWNVITGAAVLIAWLVQTFPFELMVLAATGFATWLLAQSVDRLTEYDSAKTVSDSEQIASDYRWFATVAWVVGFVYLGITIWAGSNLLMIDNISGTRLASSLVMLVLVIAMVWFVLWDAYKFRGVSPDLLAKRAAYMAKLSETYNAFELSYERQYDQDLKHNDWVVFHEDPVQAAASTHRFMARFTNFMYSSHEAGFVARSVYIINGDTAKQFDAYNHDLLMEARGELGMEYFMQYAMNALNGFTPEAALKKAQKQKKYDEKVRKFWTNSFPVRLFYKVGDGLDWILSGIVKFFTDLRAMWQLMHKYCPAVAEKKQI